jgi:hypothetical protein
MGVIEDEIPAVPPLPGTKLEVASEKRKARNEKIVLFFKSPSALIGIFIIADIVLLGGSRRYPRSLRGWGRLSGHFRQLVVLGFELGGSRVISV